MGAGGPLLASMGYTQGLLTAIDEMFVEKKKQSRPVTCKCCKARSFVLPFNLDVVPDQVMILCGEKSDNNSS